jgi:hypothetical protein
MPANRRIIEVYRGIEDGLELWTQIEKLTSLEVNDRIRIYEDREAKSKDIRLLDGYILRKPWSNEEDNISTLAIETVAERTEKEERAHRDKIQRLATINPFDENLSDEDYELLLEQCNENLEYFKKLLRKDDACENESGKEI